MDEQHWGIRVTFPVSLQSLRVSGVSDLGPFTKKLGIAGIVPGVELEVPLTDGVRMRPFAEAGFGKASDGRTEVLYGLGARLMMERQVRVAHLTYGGSGMYRNSYTSGDAYDGHGTFEAGIDTQVPLGFSIGRKEARAGGYFIARKFAGLDLVRENQETHHDRPPVRSGRELRDDAGPVDLEAQASVDCRGISLRPDAVGRAHLHEVPILTARSGT